MDTKKRELVGHFTQAGKELQPVGVPEQVSTYDFPHLAVWGSRTSHIC